MASLIKMQYGFIMLIASIIHCVSGLPSLKIQRLTKEHVGQRIPLFAPGRCGDNELLYPAEKEDEWVCDCGPGYLYYQENDACFAAYRQGPCNKGYHLILTPSDSLSTCQKNPCNEGFARYKEHCYELGTPNGPCLPILQGGGIFDVNATTLELECIKGTDRLSLFSGPSRCTPGSRRDGNGHCRVIY